MKTSKDGWAWTEIGFPEWRALVDRRLKETSAITSDDAGIDDEFLRLHWKMKQPTYEFVEWFIKHDLDPKAAFEM